MAGSGGGDGAAAAGPGAGPRQEAAGGREGRPGRRAEAALAGPHLRGEGVAARRGGSSASPRFCHSPLPPPFIPRPFPPLTLCSPAGGGSEEVPCARLHRWPRAAAGAVSPRVGRCGGAPLVSALWRRVSRGCCLPRRPQCFWLARDPVDQKPAAAR